MAPAPERLPAPPRLRLRDAVALGLLHGPAELLPISSSAHVALVPWLLDWPYAHLDGELRKSFEVALHAGTAAALLFALRTEVAATARAIDRQSAGFLAATLAPPALAGLVCERAIERRLGTPASIAAGLAGGSVAMAAADLLGARTRASAQAGCADGLALGLAQACALTPGVSRNAATLAAARWRGFARPDAHALSARTAVPVIVGATALKGLRLRRRGLPPSTARGFGAGIAASALSTLAAVRVLRALPRDRSMLGFAAYRVALAALVLGRLRRRNSINRGDLRGECIHPPRAGAQ